MRLQALILLSIAMLASGCLDTVRRHYPTRSEAEEDRLFERGWLPAAIPLSSREISTVNDLDLNQSKGAFSFAPGEAGAFISRLQPTHRSEGGYAEYTYVSGQSKWTFSVNKETGHCRYQMNPVRVR